jgi:hypothetical protein
MIETIITIVNITTILAAVLTVAKPRVKYNIVSLI